MHLYRFLSGKDDVSFCQKVSKALSEGWILYGSSHYQFDAEARAMRCGQAVTREVEESVYDPNRNLSDYE